MNNEFENILDTCLSQIEDGKASIEACLARYPEHAAQLKPLLYAATRLSRARDVMPDPSYKMRARSQLNVYMQQNPQRKRISPVFWRVSVAFATVMLLFLASGTAFAQQALPGDALYNWKLTSEHLWRFTSNDQLEYDILLSNRRVNELMEVSQDEMRRPSAIRNYEKLLIKFRNTQDPEDRERILFVLRTQRETLLNAGIDISEIEPYFPR
jgi:hypothetical protein